jgi:pantothenate kinase
MDRHYKHLNKKLRQLSIKQPKRSTHPRHEDDYHFYTRVKNLINIRFNQEEMQLLKYGLNYSIEKTVSTYLANLIAETERAIRLLDKKCKIHTALWQQKN